MKWDLKNENDRFEFIKTFLLNLKEELDRAGEFLNEDELKHFRNYYHSFYQTPLENENLKRQIRGYTRGDLGYMLSRLVNPMNTSPLHILDAGCGSGTQSLLFGLCGHRVTGIDIRKDRYDIAVKRADFYEKELGQNLNIQFKLSSIFNLEAKNQFDMIWIANAISHIDPLDQLMKCSYDFLKPSGEIVIVDLNGMNLLKKLSVLKERGLKAYKKVIDPTTGEEVSYAVERILSYPYQLSLLKRYGFKIIHRECFIGFHSRVNSLTYQRFIRPINNSLLLSSLLGSRYVVVGKKVQ